MGRRGRGSGTKNPVMPETQTPNDTLAVIVSHQGNAGGVGTAHSGAKDSALRKGGAAHGNDGAAYACHRYFFFAANA